MTYSKQLFTCFQIPVMKRKQAVAGRKLKKVASQPQGKEISSSYSSARPDVKFAPRRTKTPSDLPLHLMALFKAIVTMPSETSRECYIWDAS